MKSKPKKSWIGLEKLKAVPTGFQITFKNGVTVSVMFSYTHCCYIKDMDRRREVKNKLSNESCDAEVCIWDKNNKNLVKIYDSTVTDNKLVLGWQSPEEILKILNWSEKYKYKRDSKESRIKRQR